MSSVKDGGASKTCTELKRRIERLRLEPTSFGLVLALTSAGCLYPTGGDVSAARQQKEPTATDEADESSAAMYAVPYGYGGYPGCAPGSAHVVGYNTLPPGYGYSPLGPGAAYPPPPIVPAGYGPPPPAPFYGYPPPVQGFGYPPPVVPGFGYGGPPPVVPGFGYGGPPPVPGVAFGPPLVGGYGAGFQYGEAREEGYAYGGPFGGAYGYRVERVEGGAAGVGAPGLPIGPVAGVGVPPLGGAVIGGPGVPPPIGYGGGPYGGYGPYAGYGPYGGYGLPPPAGPPLGVGYAGYPPYGCPAY